MLLVCGAWSLPGGGRAEGDLPALLRRDAGNGSDFGVRDAYKLLHQACFGPAHLVADSSGAEAMLVRELESLDTISRQEPLVEELGGRGLYARVNLRPFKRLNLSPRHLVECMIRSAAETPSDTAVFFRNWGELRKLAGGGILPFPAEEVDLWDERVRQGNLGPVRHSRAYVASRRPAYRVVGLRLAHRLVQEGNQP